MLNQISRPLFVLLALTLGAPALANTGFDAGSVARLVEPENELTRHTEGGADVSATDFTVNVTSMDDDDHDQFAHRILTRVRPGRLAADQTFRLRLTLIRENETPRTLFTSPELQSGAFDGGKTYDVVSSIARDLEPGTYRIVAEWLETPQNPEVAPYTVTRSTQSGEILLESREYDRDPGHHHSIFRVSAWLYDDSDGDGYYTDLDLEIDADTVLHDDLVFVQVLVRDSWGDWWLIEESADFRIFGNDPDDAIALYTRLPHTLHRDSYDLRVQLFHAHTLHYLAGYGPTPSHSGLRLESDAEDTHGHSHGHGHVHVHGSASAGPILLLPLAMYMLLRRKRRD